MSNLPLMTLRRTRAWDVSCPPPKKRVLAGQFVPTVKGQVGLLPKKKRRVVIEIYGPTANDDTSKLHHDDSQKDHDDDDKDKNDVDTALMDRRAMLSRMGGQSHNLVDLSKDLHDDDVIVLRLLKPRKRYRHWGFHKDEDDEDEDDEDDDDEDDEGKDKEKQEEEKEEQDKTKKNSSNWIQGKLSDAMNKAASSPYSHVFETEDEWIEQKKFGLDSVEEEELKDNRFEANFGLGVLKQRREFVFQNEAEARDFYDQLEGLKAMVKQRAQSRLKAYQALRAESKRRLMQDFEKNASPTKTRGINSPLLEDSLLAMENDSEIHLLCEIVSASDLPIADRTSTDPYVSVYLGVQRVHKTQVVPKELNPVWTVDTSALFLVSCSAEEFFSFSSGLVFRVMDYDSLNQNDLVAHVSLTQSELLQMKGDRVSLPLVVPPDIQKRNPGQVFHPKLNVRVRKAKPEDVEFMKKLNSIKGRGKYEGVHAEASFVSPKKNRVHLLKRETKKVDGVTLHRVKPRPDPTRPEEETKWMEQSAIDAETMKPSYEWIEAGNGTLGRIYLEILKCDDLPNMDTSSLTDAYCCVIYEDAIVTTDVINDDLSPRWLPWSERAFVFRMNHPSSQILLGVFDYDVSRTPLDVKQHDTIGRVSVDVTNFKPGTVYTLSYNLYESVLDNDRQPSGKVTIRLRMEYDLQKVSLGALQPRPANYICLSSKKDFKVAYFVCNGEENINRFAMEDLTAYRTELESLIGLKWNIRTALMTILFWRGHREIKVFGWKIKLPIHSALAFYLGTTLVEDLNRFPSYCFFCVFWLLAATNEYRMKNPSPWHGSMTLFEMWYTLLLNKDIPDDIAEFENEGAIREYEAEIERHYEQEKALAKETAERAEAVGDFLKGGSSNPEDVQEDLSTKVDGGPSINPLAAALLPIQQALGEVCKVVRIARSLLMWDESHLAFIIANACLLLSFVCLWIPWSFFVRWTSRTLVWTLLGPWMKLVDIYVIPRMFGDNADPDEALRQYARQQVLNLALANEAVLQKREDVMKERAMRRYMFGRYAVKVPAWKEYRYRDVPLPESHAKPCREPQKIKIRKRSHGQTLKMNITPTWGDAVDESEE